MISLFRRFLQKPQGQQRAVRRPRGRLRLETLEDRTLLSATFATTNITLMPPYGGATTVSGLVNTSAGVGIGLSYTAATGTSIGSTVYATRAILLGSYKVTD